MEALIGIDPDQTLELKLRGAVFTIGVLDSTQWERLHHRWIVAIRQSQKRAIALLAEDATEDQRSDAVASDSQYRVDLLAVEHEALRLAVRAHRGFLKPDGSELPFETATETVMGTSLTVVASSTMRWYKLVPELADIAWRMLRGLHTLSASEKKDSPPVSSPTGDGSTAAPALDDSKT